LKEKEETQKKQHVIEKLEEEQVKQERDKKLDEEKLKKAKEEAAEMNKKIEKLESDLSDCHKMINEKDNKNEKLDTKLKDY